MPNNTHPLNGLTATIVHDELTSYTVANAEIASRLVNSLTQQPRQGFVVESSAQGFFNVQPSPPGYIRLRARETFRYIGQMGGPVLLVARGEELNFREDDAGGLRYNAHIDAVERFDYTPQPVRIDPTPSRQYSFVEPIGLSGAVLEGRNAANWLSNPQMGVTEVVSERELVKTLQHDNALLAKQVLELQAKLKELGHG